MSGSIVKLLEINQFNVTDTVDPGTVRLPKKFIIDFEKKLIRPSKGIFIISHLKKRVLVQVQGGPEFQPAGILWYFEELKQGTNTEIGPKNFFEIAYRRTSKIERAVHIENMPILQGFEEGLENVDDGLAWRMTISKKTGKVVLSASGGSVEYVVFGTCTSVDEF